MTRFLWTFGVSAGLTWLCARYLIARRVSVDLPDERRLHKIPTPRGGGIGMPWAVAIVTVVAILVSGDSPSPLVRAIGLIALPHAILGTVDDFRPLSAGLKFAVQFLLAAMFIALGFGISSLQLVAGISVDAPVVAALVTAVFLVWNTNTFNFMDGMDAIAAGSGMVFFLAYVALFLTIGGEPQIDLAVLAACIGALFGFFLLNFPPARIFMGDGGALFIGSALAIVIVSLVRAGLPIAIAILPSLTFLWDTTYTLLMRMARREKWYRAHCRHLYQRLALTGVAQWTIRGVYFGLAGAYSGLAIVLSTYGAITQLIGVGCALIPCVALTIYTERRERRYQGDALSRASGDAAGGVSA